jgi:hypothetical protein
LGQLDQWHVGDPKTFGHPIPPWDVNDIDSTENRLKNIAIKVKKQNAALSKFGEYETETDPGVAIKHSWFSESIFAREKIAAKMKKRYNINAKSTTNSLGLLRVYHGLNHFDLGEMSLSHYSKHAHGSGKS